jgi:hypothetical protein
MTKVDILIIITENHLHLNTTSFKLPYLRHCRIYKRDSQAKSAIFHTEKSSKKTNFNSVSEDIYLKLMLLKAKAKSEILWFHTEKSSKKTNFNCVSKDIYFKLFIAKFSFSYVVTNYRCNNYTCLCTFR